MTQVKICSQCKETKNVKEFTKLKRSADGLKYQCKDCISIWNKRWRDKNLDKHREDSRKWYELNRQRALEVKKEYWKNNKEEIQARRYSYQLHANRLRDNCLKEQCPEWADLSKIKEVYDLARSLTKETGIQYHVDHIEPLRGKGSNGLHVHYNLRAIPAKQNLSKGNRLGG